MTSTLNCSDGSSGSDTATVRWQIRDNGETLTATPEGGACGSFTANIGSDPEKATFVAKSCPDRFLGNTTMTSRITGGTVRMLDSGGISLALEQSMTLSGEVNGTCTGQTSGTLSREESN